MYVPFNNTTHAEQEQRQQFQLVAVDLQLFFIEVVLIIIVLLVTIVKRLRRLDTDVADASSTATYSAVETSDQTARSAKEEFHKNCWQITSEFDLRVLYQHFKRLYPFKQSSKDETET